MRLIQATLVRENVKPLTEWLEGEDMEYVLLSEEKDKFSHLLMVPVEDGQVEEVLGKLKGLGIEQEGYLTVSDVEVVVSDKIENQREEAEEDANQRISREELVEDVRSLFRNKTNYFLFIILSAIVATAGLLMDSASVVVGSMVIAPLIGPAMASSVGSVVKDDELFDQGIIMQLLGVMAAIGGSALFALLLRIITAPQLNLMLIGQIAERVHPGLLSLAVALAAGVAGALSLTSGASAALVGVMIAVALIPPIATVGLGLAYLNLIVIVSSFTLVAVNMLSINLAALVTLWLKGYRPDKYYEEKQAFGLTFRRGGILIGAILILSLFLAFTTFQQRSNSLKQQKILSAARKNNLEVMDYRMKFEMSWLFRRPSSMTLIVEKMEPEQREKMRQFLRNNNVDFTL
ncbi:MAG: TIGR00341 family protein, partial [bacterium]